MVCRQGTEKQTSFNRFKPTVSLLEAQTMHGIRKQPGCRARLGEVESGRGKSAMGVLRENEAAKWSMWDSEEILRGSEAKVKHEPTAIRYESEN
jgi:hypothetical protein